jgi:SH3-like domain-containing protein
MSRTSTILIFTFVSVLLVSLIGTAAFVLGRAYFTITDSDTNISTPLPLVTTTATATAVPDEATATVTATLGATAVPNATVIPSVTTVPATTISVSTTAVQYVKALADVNMRSGPGTSYNIIGWVAAGQTARVTGISIDNSWWRVVCPDSTIGNCWVTAGTQYTQPTSAPGNNPTATPTSTACTNSASLIADVSVPDGTQFAPASGFNKTWRIKNTGTCTWDSSYQIVHAGGNLMGAVSSFFPLRDTVLPGQTVDLTISMVSPATAGNYQSDWKLQNSKGQLFGVGRNNSPFWTKITVTASQTTIISGLVYQDTNSSGGYNNGDTLMSNREVWLVPETDCNVRNQAVATALTGGDGRFTLSGNFNGNYCLALPGNGGLEDVISLALAPGQVLNSIYLRAAIPNSSISGYVWNDYCKIIDNGAFTEGNCVPNGSGSFRADGMIQPTESNISGITVLLQLGTCPNNNAVAVSSVTDASGRYTFGNLAPGTYCVSINATDNANVAKLLPGDWTFPTNGISYQELTLQPGAQAYSVNFGWDYQLD